MGTQVRYEENVQKLTLTQENDTGERAGRCLEHQGSFDYDYGLYPTDQ